MSPVVLAVLSFVSLALFFAGIAWLVRNWNAPMMARLRALGRGGRGEETEVSVIQDDRPKHAVERFLTGLGKTTTAPEEAKAAQPELVKKTKPKVDLGMQLVQAGIRRPNALALLTGIRLALAAGLVVLGVLAAGVFNTALLPTAFALAPIGFVLPRFIVARMAARRQEEIQRHLPDAIDLLLLCVEAGLGLNAALVKVAEERSTNAEDPIGQELTQLSKELQVGVGRKEAFRNLAERTGAAEIRSLAAHLIQSERFGTSISQTLRQHSESMRTHRRLAAEEMANKTQIKLLFPLIMFIFPSVMIVILMPAVMRLMDALKNLM